MEKAKEQLETYEKSSQEQTENAIDTASIHQSNQYFKLKGFKLPALPLKYLLSLSFILLTIIPIYFVTQYLYTLRANEYKTAKLEQLSNYSEAMKMSIINSLIDVKEKSNLIANRTQMRRSLANWQQTGDKNELFYIEQIIEDARKDTFSLKNITIYSKEGIPIVSSPPSKALPLNISQVNNQNTTTLYLTNSHENISVQQRLSLMLNEELIGYITVLFRAPYIDKVIDNREVLGKTGEILLARLTNQGTAEFITQDQKKTIQRFEKIIVTEMLPSPMAKSLLGEEMALPDSIDYTDTDVMAFIRYIPELALGLVVKIDKKEIDEHVSEEFNGIYTIGALVMFFAVILGLVLSFRIASPIEALNKHIRNQKKGDLPKIFLNPRGWKEVKALTNTYNIMIQDINELNKDLNLKVKERTLALQKANESLKEMAIKDSLTGLYNRRYIMETLAHDLKKASRLSMPYVISMLDIDYFKTINDTLGHPAGDHVLKRIAQCLLDHTRRSELIGRIGGEEFMIAFMNKQSEENTNNQGILTFFEEIRHSIESLTFEAPHDQLKITASIGITQLQHPNQTLEELIHQADAALYKAKACGRNQICFYNQSLGLK